MFVTSMTVGLGLGLVGLRLSTFPIRTPTLGGQVWYNLTSSLFALLVLAVAVRNWLVNYFFDS